MKKINFYSGPAILPEIVRQQAIEAINNFEGTGLSILEISHRSKPFVEVMQKARALVKELMGLDDEYEVLFLQGGASTQFHAIPYNLLGENETAIYFDTGTWAHGALTEAQLFGKVHLAASSKQQNYNHIPKSWNFDVKDSKVKYLHLTTNNTIYGTQWSLAELVRLKKEMPQEALLIADMSSDIFSRETDYSIFDLIYAGAQKNMGIAGTTVVVIRKSILQKGARKIPKMIDYHLQIENESMKNTPAVFAVYCSLLVLEWIEKQGVKTLSGRNSAKAKLLYDAIDASPVFKGSVVKEDRSEMNICFVTGDAAIDEKFSKQAKNLELIGLEGHRSVGGFRASVYNAMEMESVKVLANLIRNFA